MQEEVVVGVVEVFEESFCNCNSEVKVRHFFRLYTIGVENVSTYHRNLNHVKIYPFPPLLGRMGKSIIN